MTYPGSPSPDDAATAAPTAEPPAPVAFEPVPPAPAAFEPVPPAPAAFEPVPPAPAPYAPVPPAVAVGATAPVETPPAVAVMPVPSPPTYDPTAAVPYSAPPVSGAYGYMMPVSAFPAVAPPRPKRTGVIVLSVLATLLLLAGAALGALTYMGRQETARLTTELAELEAAHETQTKKLEGVERDLSSSTSELDDARDEMQDVKADNVTLGACVTAFWALDDAYIASNGRQTDDTRNKAADMIEKCLAAESAVPEE